MPIHISRHSSAQYNNINRDINNTTDQTVKAQKSTDKSPIRLSSESKFLSSLEQHISALPIVNEHKVEEVKKKLENNDYTINYSSLAERIIKIENEIH